MPRQLFVYIIFPDNMVYGLHDISQKVKFFQMLMINHLKDKCIYFFYLTDTDLPIIIVQ